MQIGQQWEGRRALLSVQCSSKLLYKSHLFLLPAAAGGWEHCKPLCGKSVKHPLRAPLHQNTILLPSTLLLALYFPCLPIFILFPPAAPIKLFYLPPTSPSTFCPSLLLSHIHKSLPNFSSETHCYTYVYTFRLSGSHFLSAVSLSHEEDQKKGVESNKK